MIEGHELEAGKLDAHQEIEGVLPASSRLSPLTLEASNALLPPLRSHDQQLGELAKS